MSCNDHDKPGRKSKPRGDFIMRIMAIREAPARPIRFDSINMRRIDLAYGSRES